jgi:hypothetical protein
MNPWVDPDFGNMMAMTMLQKMGYDAERKQRVDRQMVDEALEICGFKAVPVKLTPYADEKPTIQLHNAKGEELNLEEKKQLANAYDCVKAEHKQRAKEAADARMRAAQAEQARCKAEYDAIAAPFREQRRLKMQKRLAAEQARKAPE